MLLTQPALYYVRKLCGLTASLESVAKRTDVLEEASVVTVPPAIFLESSLARVTGVGADTHTTVDAELRLIRGGAMHHDSVIAYTLDRAALCDGRVFRRGCSYGIGKQRPHPLHWRGAERVRRAVMTATWTGSRYFAHWIVDDLSLQLLGAELGDPVTIARPLTKHQAEYQALLGISVPALRTAQFDELVLVKDHAQGRSKIARYTRLRAMLLQAVPSAPHRGVMIMRGESGTRRVLTNEAELAERLRSLGFRIIRPEGMSAREIVAQIAGARVVVGVEGSHLAHALLCMDPAGAYLIIQPPNRFISLYKGYADSLGLGYGFVVGEQRGGDFSVDIDETLAVLNLLEARQASS
ncbi:MAG: hypothetical protein JWN48_5410 [Myxococcaceae bacterium]|nr:hypothetical protein [Myxococcaceae bacterium]